MTEAAGIVAARIDRAGFDAAGFPVMVQVPLRFSDIDLQNHVNNVAAMALLQEGRIAFNAFVKVAELGALRPMVAGMIVEYAGQLFAPDPVEVSAGVLRIGRSSLTLAQRIRQAGRTAIYAQVTMALTNGAAAQPIPPNYRARYEALMLIPQAC